MDTSEQELNPSLKKMNDLRVQYGKKMSFTLIRTVDLNEFYSHKVSVTHTYDLFEFKPVKNQNGHRYSTIPGTYPGAYGT